MKHDNSHSEHSEHGSHSDHSEHGSHSEQPTSAAAMDHSGHDMGQHSSHMDFIGASLAILFFIAIGIYFYKKAKIYVSEKRFDLFKLPGFEKAVKSPYFSFFLRLLPALLFVFVIATGLFGRERANFAAPFTWLFWWTLLIFFVAFGGKIFCAACPWDFFANLFQFGWFHRTKGKVQSLNIKWPKALSNIYLAVLFFVVLTWLELGANVTHNSYATAILGLIVVALAVFTALIFEKRAFCRYACPIGRISGVYAQFSPLELRVKDNDVCKACRTKDCVKGGPVSTPCPTGEIPFKLKQNTYCTLCTECVRSCDKNNLTLKMRAPGYDLQNINTVKSDEFVMFIVILVLTFFHGLTMTPIWFDWTAKFETHLGLNYMTSFSILMAIILGVSYGFFVLFDKIMDKRTKTSGLSLNLIFSFIPLVLGYHVGHNIMHILGEGLHLVPLLNDPFGYGWSLFGLDGFKAYPLIGHGAMKGIQLFCVAIGFYYSVKILRTRYDKITANVNAGVVQLKGLFLSHYMLLLLFGLLSIWFIFQPMVMRSSY